MHRVTQADGPGSPGGLGKPGKAEAEGGRDPRSLAERKEQSGGPAKRPRGDDA